MLLWNLPTRCSSLTVSRWNLSTRVVSRLISNLTFNRWTSSKANKLRIPLITGVKKRPTIASTTSYKPVRIIYILHHCVQQSQRLIIENAILSFRLYLQYVIILKWQDKTKASVVNFEMFSTFLQCTYRDTSIIFRYSLNFFDFSLNFFWVKLHSRNITIAESLEFEWFSTYTV